MLTGGPHPPEPALASHAGGADNWLIDMDPTGNTATSIGSVETCARINRNGFQDADEDGVDSVQLDVVVGPAGIPASTAMLAFGFNLVYPVPLRIIAANSTLLIAAAPDSAPSNAGGDSVPDTDGSFYVGVADTTDVSLHPGVHESGPGILSRIGIGAPAPASGVYQLRIQGPIHVDPDNKPHLPDNGSISDVAPGALVAVGTACPPAVDMVANSTGVSAPGSVGVGAPFAVSVNTSLSNAGALPLAVRAISALQLPDDCIANSIDASSSIMLPAGGPTVVKHMFTVTCFSVTTISLGATAAVGLDTTLAREANVFNNAVIATPAVIDVMSVSASVDFAVSSGKLYISRGDRIRRANPDGSGLVTVYQRPGGFLESVAVDVVGGKMYFNVGERVRRANLDGTGEETVTSLNPALLVRDGDFDAGRLYGIRAEFPINLARMNLDGSGLATSFVPSLEPRSDVAVDPAINKVFWVSGTGVHRANLDFSAKQTIVGFTEAGSIDLDPFRGKVYWSSYDGNANIFRANLDGTGAEQIVFQSAFGNETLDLAVDWQAEKLYWISQNSIWKANLDGTQTTPILPSIFAERIVFVPRVADDECPNVNAPDLADGDGDAVADTCDLCPITDSGADVDMFGCALGQVDGDGDGVCDDTAPSNGPAPGCVRSVAVGGIAGLLEGDAAGDEPAATERVDDGMVVARVAAVLTGVLAVAGVATWRLRRRLGRSAVRARGRSGRRHGCCRPASEGNPAIRVRRRTAL